MTPPAIDVSTAVTAIQDGGVALATIGLAFLIFKIAKRVWAKL